VSSPKLKLLFITADPEMATFAINQGVDRIFLDLEMLGKVERQGHLDTLISRHKAEDISSLRPLLPKGSLLVRLNPVNPGTADEVEDVISRGADILMLPMFRGPEKVKQFCDLVNSRARVCLLVETIGAMETLADCIQVPGVDEVHIGLNDLHLEMGCNFMFEPLVFGPVENMARILKNAGVPFGIGGLARVGEGLLPAELILSEHARLGSTRAILSRTFHRQASSVRQIQDQMNFGDEVQKLHLAYQSNCQSSLEELSSRHMEIREIVAEIADKLSERKRMRLSGI
jgi:2-keto-3-deoxy-L-rhamnonate aldolase RhmA